jgi:hypothetical protein
LYQSDSQAGDYHDTDNINSHDSSKRQSGAISSKEGPLQLSGIKERREIHSPLFDLYEIQVLEKFQYQDNYNQEYDPVPDKTHEKAEDGYNNVEEITEYDEYHYKPKDRQYPSEKRAGCKA